MLYLNSFLVNASRMCLAGGVWDDKTDYNDCMLGQQQQVIFNF